MKTSIAKKISCPLYEGGSPWLLSQKAPFEGCANKAQCLLLKEAEEQLKSQKTEMVRILATTLQHEIDNPLTIVLGYAELLLKYEEIPWESREKLEQIREAGLRIEKVVLRLTQWKDEKIRVHGNIPILDLHEIEKEKFLH